MRGLVLAAVLVAVLAAAPSAAAKEIQSVTACGAGDCATSKARVLLLAMTDVGPPADGPASQAPFYKLTIVVGDGGKAVGRFKSWWDPSAGRLLGEDGTWMAVRPALGRRLDRLTRGLAPRPAARLPGVRPTAAPATDALAPPRTAPIASTGGVPVVPVVVAVTLLVFAVVGVRRRAGIRLAGVEDVMAVARLPPGRARIRKRGRRLGRGRGA